MNQPTPSEALPDLAADAARVAALVLAEDGSLDLTTAVAVQSPRAARGRIECRHRTVVAGLRYAEAVARAAGCSAGWDASEGAVSEPGPIGHLEGDLAEILRAERPLLNLLQRGCGIATATRDYVLAVAGFDCRILHTRKTAPGLRLFDAAAVVAGGGGVHRLDLSRTIMIKDNHWRAVHENGGSLAEVLAEARRRGALACQVEVETEAQLREACSADADRILVDNQTPATVREWGELARSLRPGIALEATGGITLDNAREYARAGANYLSVGALTHSVKAADIALELG
ncbi:MAG TPA: carboxylating nicotinate-nucleotide diphosphorylase [Gemmatimonadales bacterium]|nr:carboxylating nicotinate-nucleotide diphosphorylase [Gemmatimonadales bacterium]